MALKAAWSKVTSATIANIYRKVGFVTPNQILPDAESDCEDAESDCEDAESDCEDAESDCEDAESDCEDAESDCEDAESDCEDAESDCEDAESDHEDNLERAPEDPDRGPDVNDHKTTREFRNIWDRLNDLFGGVPPLDEYIEVNRKCRVSRGADR